MEKSSRDITCALVERTLEQLTLLDVCGGEIQSKGKSYNPKKMLECNGVSRIEENHVSCVFKGAQGSYQVKLLVPEALELANGITVKYRITGWDDTRYLAIGHTAKEGFRHVKIANPQENEWVTFSIGYQDVAYGLKNKWQEPEPDKIPDIRLYMSGTPSNIGATIELMWAATWLEQREQHSEWAALDKNEELISLLQKYFIRCNPHINEHVESYLTTGDCPLTGQVKLPWPIHKPQPDGMSESGTYRYLWHAMQPAISMMVYAKNTETAPPIYAARDYINDWLEQSFFKPDVDVKYAWYDHGVAERLLAFLFMLYIGVDENFDYRFMSRLKLAIFKHAQLLESEVFYASHQPTRYHNHAWFQDMALIAAAVAMPETPCAGRWLDRGIERLNDQLAQLIVRDNGYAIFIENSIGYHHGIQKLVEFAGDLVKLSERNSDISTIADELNAWSSFLRYPDGRSPSQGDTFRQPNPSGRDIKRGVAYDNLGCTILPSAGYAVIKGNHDEIPFMLCMFATSLCKTHKHEDNLSFTLFFDGIEWLIDPSFYSHEYDNHIPSYLRSARAHNAVSILNEPYSIDPNTASLNGQMADFDYSIRGVHSAYEDILVTREIVGCLESLSITGKDQVETKTQKQVNEAFLVFQVGEGVVVSRNNDNAILKHPGSEYFIVISCYGQTPEIYSASSKDPSFIGIAGGGFMQCNSTQTVVYRIPLNEEVVWNLSAAKVM